MPSQAPRRPSGNRRLVFHVAAKLVKSESNALQNLDCRAHGEEFCLSRAGMTRKKVFCFLLRTQTFRRPIVRIEI